VEKSALSIHTLICPFLEMVLNTVFCTLADRPHQGYLFHTGVRVSGGQTALTVTLLGFKNGRAVRMALFAHAQPGSRRLADAGRLKSAHQRRHRGHRTESSGRRGAASSPAGSSRLRSAGVSALPPCRVRGHAPPGARRAPRALEKTYRKFSRSDQHRSAQFLI
jgi:hypothetical protein